MTIIVALLVFSAIVFIHELGHFLFAKINGVKVHEFAIGMGPKLFSIKKDTEYSVRLLPLGGFVSMEGEDEDSKDPRSFGQKSILQRASIIFAGPFFNIVLTIILFIPIFMFIGNQTTTLANVTENGPAFKAGIRAGDTIEAINGEEVKTWQDVIHSLNKSDGSEVKISVDRNGNDEELKVTPQKTEDGRYVIGIETKVERSFISSIKNSFATTWEMAVQMVTFVGQLVTGTIPGGLENSVSGPLGVINIVSEAAKTGIVNIMYIAAVLSLNLGILNLVPFPALDGGRLFMLGLEAIRGGKRIDPNKEAMINIIGLGA
ncbi:MAG: RIP metalloprotease RseP, partial [Peptostreptococcaceae bacterium]